LLARIPGGLRYDTVREKASAKTWLGEVYGLGPGLLQQLPEVLILLILLLFLQLFLYDLVWQSRLDPGLLGLLIAGELRLLQWRTEGVLFGYIVGC
jgi:hypothetical protein